MDDQKNNPPQDQIAEDDFDFEDIEDISDADLEDIESDFDEADFDEEEFESEDWDSFDDEDPAMAASAAQAAPAKKKSFVQKNFNAIVIGVASIIAVFIFLSQISGGDNQNTTQNTAETFATVQNDMAPAEEIAPMPSAMDDTLTTSADAANDNGEIFNIDAMPEAAPEDAANNIAFDPEKPENALTPMPETLEISDNSNTDEIFEEVPGETLDLDISQIDNVVTPEPEMQDMDEPMILEPVAEMKITEDAAVSASAGSTGIAALETELTQAQNTIKELKSELSKLRLERDAAVAEFRSASQMAEQAEEKARAAMRKAESAQKAASNAQPLIMDEPKVIEAPKVIAPKPATTSTPRRAVNNAAAEKSWTLRSAQPGTAMISEKGTNDMRNIAVGDTIPGLGLIQYIGQQNGLWVVKGTKAKVSQ